MKTNHAIRISMPQVFVVLVLVTSLGLLGCSNSLASKPASSGISIEVLGAPAASGARALMTDGAVSTVTVKAYLFGTPYTDMGTATLTKGATTWTGSMPSFPTGSYDTLFRAFVKDSAGNFLYYGEARQTVTDATTSVTNPITVSLKTALTTVNLNTVGTATTYGTLVNYAIFAGNGIASSGSSTVTGDIGLSAAVTHTAFTGFSETIDSLNDFATSAQLVSPSKMYAYDYTGGQVGSTNATPGKIVEAKTNMTDAYTYAAGCTSANTGGATLTTGLSDISSMTLIPGIYNATSGLLINSDVHLNGGPADVWIFQVGTTLALAGGINIILDGGAVPEHVFWQCAGTPGVTIAASTGTTTVFRGVAMTADSITVGSNAVIHGRLFAQNAVTLNAGATVTQLP